MKPEHILLLVGLAGLLVAVIGRRAASALNPADADNVVNQQVTGAVDAVVRPRLAEYERAAGGSEPLRFPPAVDAALADGEITLGEAIYLGVERLKGNLGAIP